jgi:hypothetical protein
MALHAEVRLKSNELEDTACTLVQQKGALSHREKLFATTNQARATGRNSQKSAFLETC